MGEVIKRNGRLYLRFYDSDGRRRMRAAAAGSHSEARKELLRLEVQIDSGASVEPVERLTVAELCERFLASSHPTAKDAAAYRKKARGALGPLLPLVGHLQVDKLRRFHIENARDKLSERYSANSVRFALRPLGTALSWAVRQELILQSPMLKMTLPRRQNSTDRLTAAQAQRLLAVARDRALGCTHKYRPLHYALYLAVELALRLGLRRGEIFGLRWSAVDFERSRLTVERQRCGKSPKSGKSRTLPLPAVLADALKAWRAECPASAEGLVLPCGFHAIEMIDQLMRAAELPIFKHPLHALRHTFASLVIEAGGSILAVKEALGHSALNTTLIYSHIAPAALAADLDKLKI
jgi:integrase